MKYNTEHYDVVVCGGGLAGLSAAVAAARMGLSTCLVNDRPVLGGNSSSEIRVVPRGAAVYHGYARETGVVSELLIRERLKNHEEIFENGWTNSVWDLEMYDLVQRTPNLTLHLNTTVRAVRVVNGAIASVTGFTPQAETEVELVGKMFVDCTGDGIVADLAGCEWRMGTEGRAEFDEPHAPEGASDDVMGNSIHIKSKDVGYPVDFVLPEWAIEYTDADFFYNGGRNPHTVKGGYWWLEIGVPWHTIYDNERIRHELTRHALGVWDWIKNKDPKTKEKAANFALDWVGQVPGKRESRRIMGEYLMTEADLTREEPFPDEVAYGGWNIDLHTPGGLLAATSEPTAAANYDLAGHASMAAYVGPFGIPLRSLIAKDVSNLFMAGRNISVTHVALGSVRVQLTTALLGQAAGTAAAVALTEQILPAQVPALAIEAVQQQLLRDGAFLPNVRNADSNDLALAAVATASSEALNEGVGPDDVAVEGGLANWSRNLDDSLVNTRAQWIAVEAGDEARGVQSLSVLLTNRSARDIEVPAHLYAVDHIWDYRAAPSPALAETMLTVPAGSSGWITWDVGLASSTIPDVQHGTVRYVRLDLEAMPEIEWNRAGRVQPGCLSAFMMSSGRLRRYQDGLTMSYRVDPPQAAYPAAQVITGEARPHVSTNEWRSDPVAGMPQWLQLDWPQAKSIRSIHLTFAGHLLREYDRYSTHYRDPQCVRDYELQAWDGDAWVTIVSESGNGEMRRVHELEHAVVAEKVRLVVMATNGDPGAALYEIRCYG